MPEAESPGSRTISALDELDCSMETSRCTGVHWEPAGFFYYSLIVCLQPSSSLDAPAGGFWY